MKEIEYDIEWNLEQSHWWFSGRRKLLQMLLHSMKIPIGTSIIDIGCGVGSNLGALQTMGFKVIGIDSEFYGLFLAKQHFPIPPLVNGDLLNLPIKSKSLSVVLAMDVLEHLNEDTIGIKEIHRTLTQGGIVILTVPAFRFLCGVQDSLGMHRRRYTKRELLAKIEREGFRVLRSSYFNLLLFFPILISRYIIRLLKVRIESENQLTSPLMNVLLKWIFSREPLLLRLFQFPFGVSVFCVAVKR